MIVLKEKQKLIVDIKRIGINGEGIAYYQKLAIFIDDAIPGETVEIEIEEVNPKFSKGKVIRYIEKSKDRVEPFCKYYGECGGCQLQHLDYKKSLDYKREIVFLALSRYANVNPRSFEIKKTIGMENPLNYRNKSSLPVNFDGTKVYCGMYAKNSNKLIRIDSCPIQNENLNKINETACNMIKKNTLTCFHPKTKKGHLRYVVARTSLNSGYSQVSFILNEETSKINNLAKDMLGKNNIVSVYKSFNNDLKSPDIFKDNVTKLLGEDSIYEKLGDLNFSLLPNAFFQLNPVQTVKLYDEVKKACKSTKDTVIWDCYCGVGTISLWLNDKAKKVIGFDINKQSISSAKANLSLNKNIKNVEFYERDLTQTLPKSLIEGDNKPDIIVADPPRTGLNQLKDLILQVLPKQFIYVSCNPSTLAKDLSVLCDKYNVKYIQPIDMFPFTSSVESVCVLELKK